MMMTKTSRDVINSCSCIGQYRLARNLYTLHSQTPEISSNYLEVKLSGDILMQSTKQYNVGRGQMWACCWYITDLGTKIEKKTVRGLPRYMLKCVILLEIECPSPNTYIALPTTSELTIHLSHRTCRDFSFPIVAANRITFHTSLKELANPRLTLTTPSSRPTICSKSFSVTPG